MKKYQSRFQTKKVAMFAGAAALTAFTVQSHAQTSVDALLNKLEQKGILTVDEARELKSENATNSVDDFNKALGAKFPMPDWITSYKLSGDFRGRFDEQSSDNNAFVDRTRLRYRLRAGLVVNMKDNLQAGFRLGSGDTGGGITTGASPLSNNSTFQDNGTKKPVWIDAAYGRWTPINDGTWMLMGTFGKMDQPFQASPMMFDPDYTPEGGAINASYKINDAHSLLLNSAVFALDEESGSTHDPLMYGAQLIWNATWAPKISSSLGVAVFDLVNRDMLTTANVPNINQGNTRNAAGGLIYNYNPIFVDGSVTYKLDSFPLYAGAFPIKLAGEYLNNPGAAHNNEGYWGGITFGKSGTKHTWDISYRYQYLEGDAWYEEFVDDDNIAYYPTTQIGESAGMFGGTNVKGHLVKFNYSLTDALTLSVTCFVNSLINNPSATASSDAMHVMADVMWKF
jgi:Putative porin